MIIFEGIDKNMELDEIKSQTIECKLSNDFLANVTVNNNGTFDEIKSMTIEYTSNKETIDDSDDRKLLCKLDLRLIPGLTLLYLLITILIDP
jgi:hypothetical protein